MEAGKAKTEVWLGRLLEINEDPVGDLINKSICWNCGVCGHIPVKRFPNNSPPPTQGMTRHGQNLESGTTIPAQDTKFAKHVLVVSRISRPRKEERDLPERVLS